MPLRMAKAHTKIPNLFRKLKARHLAYFLEKHVSVCSSMVGEQIPTFYTEGQGVPQAPAGPWFQPLISSSFHHVQTKLHMPSTGSHSCSLACAGRGLGSCWPWAAPPFFPRETCPMQVVWSLFLLNLIKLAGGQVVFNLILTSSCMLCKHIFITLWWQATHTTGQGIREGKSEGGEWVSPGQEANKCVYKLHNPQVT